MTDVMNQIIKAYAKSEFVVYTDDFHIDYISRTLLKLNRIEKARMYNII